jgi:hypothetical protein
MKLQLKGCRFDKSGGDPAGIAERSWYASRTGLQHAFQKWQRCADAQGDYFEGDAAQTYIK